MNKAYTNQKRVLDEFDLEAEREGNAIKKSLRISGPVSRASVSSQSKRFDAFNAVKVNRMVKSGSIKSAYLRNQCSGCKEVTCKCTKNKRRT